MDETVNSFNFGSPKKTVFLRILSANFCWKKSLANNEFQENRFLSAIGFLAVCHLPRISSNDSWPKEFLRKQSF